MISKNSHSQEWIMRVRETAFGKDPILIEKMIMALTLHPAICQMPWLPTNR